MSIKNSYTTADYLEWDKMLNLVRRLYRDANYRMSVLVGCGSFFGLRISDLLTLKWSMLLDSDRFVIIEKKTGKRREIKINANFQKHIADCFKALNITDRDEYCFINSNGGIYTVQHINKLFKGFNEKYNLRVEHISTHSLRKTFGRCVVEQAEENSEMALIRLMELFNHSSVAITKKYLGLRHRELMETYELLEF